MGESRQGGAAKSGEGGGWEGSSGAINTSQVTGPVNEGRELVTFRGALERGQGAMTWIHGREKIRLTLKGVA